MALRSWIKRLFLAVLLALAAALVAAVAYYMWPRTYHPAAGTTIPGNVTVQSMPGEFDWPQFRGPRRDGTSRESPAWAGNPKELWRKELGRGASSMAVSRGRLFTSSNRDDKDIVWCLDAGSGHELWRFEYDCPLEKRQFEGGPAATPTVEGDRVYTLSHEGQLFCLDVVRGTLIWAVHVVTGLGGDRPFWGYAGSPLIVGESLIVDVGGAGRSTVALDKGTGKVIWKAGDGAPGYSSPVLFDAGGKAALAIFKAEALVAQSLEDGRVLWLYPWETSYGVNASMPIVAGDKVFLSSGYGKGCALLDIGSGQPKPLWESKEMRTHFGSCLLYRGHVYGVDDAGRAKCMDFATGEVKWQQDGFGTGTVILAGDKLVLLSESGELRIAEATPEGYREITRARVLSGRCWVSPALAGGLLYVKDNEGSLVCLDLRG